MQKHMTKMTTFLGRVACAASFSLFAMAPLPAAAQSLFSPALTVNGDPITYYELDQRERLLTILNAPGDRKAQARQGMIDDRLKQQAFDQIDFTISSEEVAQGLDDFASRGNLTADQMIASFEGAGVGRDTLEDFIRVTLTWRNYIQARFNARARPSESEIDRAMGQQGSQGGIEVLISELIIPFTPQTQQEAMAIADDISRLTSLDAFSNAARQYSATNSRSNGGKLPWTNLSKLPPALQPILMELANGEVTAPLTLPDAVALFQMRGMREVATGAPKYSAIEYATFYLGGGRTAENLTRAQEIKNSIDTCDDLYGIAKDLPPEVLQRHSKQPADIPNDIALELAKLDTNEVSTALTTNGGGNLILLMLCGRTTELTEEATRTDIANALMGQRLGNLADSTLDQMRADALIIDK